MAKITYEDKDFLNKNENIADKNKVNDTDLNEIKNTVNENDTNVGDLSDLNTIDKSSIVNSINEVNKKEYFVYNENLQSPSPTINFNNLDLVNEPGFYEFEAELWTNASSTPDIQISFNDISDYYNYVSLRKNGALNADGTLTLGYQYYNNKSSVTNWTTNPFSDAFPVHLQGKVYLMSSDVSGKYKIYYKIDYVQFSPGHQITNTIDGMVQLSIDNLNSITIYSGNNSLSYTTNSKIMLRKVTW